MQDLRCKGRNSTLADAHHNLASRVRRVESPLAEMAKAHWGFLGRTSPIGFVVPSFAESDFPIRLFTVRLSSLHVRYSLSFDLAIREKDAGV